MSGIRVQAYADKIVNKGGGMKQYKKWVTTIEEVQGKEEEVRELVKVEEKTGGSDYIVFHCPACQKRNKQVAFNAKPEEKGNVLVFRCNGCLRQVEVKRPINLATPSDNLVKLPGSLNYNKKRG